MATRDTSFYYSFFVLPPPKRKAIIAVWDFCRAVDDAVDGTAGSRPDAGRDVAWRELTRWRDELDRCYSGATPETPQGRRLLPHVTQFKLPRRAFEDLIDGVEMDLNQDRYETFEALRQYCLRVASAVGLICVEIFGYRDARTRDYAVELGIALQLTNIVRDVPADLERGRLYLPLEDLKRFGCSEADLRAGIVTDKVRALLRHEGDLARSYYRRAQATLPAHDARRLIAARIMGAIYLELLGTIERSGYDVFNSVIRVPRPRRAAIAATTWLKAMIGIR